MSKDVPHGEPATRTLAMPGDTNPHGDVFGGWVLSQMDIAGGVVASETSRGRSVTVAVESMTFIRPVLVGDILGCYTEVINIGRTSMKIKIEAWVRRDFSHIKVTEGIFTYVAVDRDRRPRAVPKNSN
ncbi:MAG: acyl-CoA thioesterase [Bdellovibrionales bacterium]|nr:acyl-CoA thioesterase [Bdellovibrionales bacterium]